MSIDSHRASPVVARVHQHSRAVIEAELGRLARRVQRLTPDDIEVIDAALDDLVERLLLARVRAMPDHADRLGSLLVPCDDAH